MLEIKIKRTDAPPAGLSSAAWALLREMLADRGYPDPPQIAKNRWGKPYFPGHSIHFNLSHTQGALAVAISDAPVGIDLQSVRPISPAVAARFLGTDSTDPALLTRKWAEYESYGKFLGCGIPITLPDQPHALQSLDLGGLMLAVCTREQEACCPMWVD